MFYNKGDGNRVSTLDRMYDEYLSEIHNAKEDRARKFSVMIESRISEYDIKF